MHSTLPLTSILLALSIFTAAAADPAKPDFSGQWELDPAKSEGLPPDMKQSMTIKQTNDRLEVTVKIRGPKTDRDVNDVYTLDGKPAEFTPAMLGSGKATKGTRTATWAAGSRGFDVHEEAVVETEDGTDTIKGTRTWRLSGDGKTLTIEIDLAGEKGAMKGRRVYEKQ